VKVVTVIHSDESCYLDEVSRIGANCNAIVCVSNFLAEKYKHHFPHLTGRIHYIPHGIPLPKTVVSKRDGNERLRLCYCNRLSQYQKRVFDLPLLAQELERLGVDYELDIAGDGPDADELKQRFGNARLKHTVRFHGRIPNETVMELYRQSHLFLLTSDFEGLPISLLEAMSVGCVPVAYKIDSGIADAIPDESYGNLVEHGRIEAMAQVIYDHAQNRSKLHNQSICAQSRIEESFSIERMCGSYADLFYSLVKTTEVSRTQKVIVPRDLKLWNRIHKKFKRFINPF
jgi:glycosyltransferase involved in cell wall biosynthesis